MCLCFTLVTEVALTPTLSLWERARVREAKPNGRNAQTPNLIKRAAL
jgi:hypothetical protein